MPTDNDLIRRYLNSGKSNLTEEDVFGNLGVEAAPQLEEAVSEAPSESPMLAVEAPAINPMDNLSPVANPQTEAQFLNELNSEVVPPADQTTTTQAATSGDVAETAQPQLPSQILRKSQEDFKKSQDAVLAAKEKEIELEKKVSEEAYAMELERQKFEEAQQAKRQAIMDEVVADTKEYTEYKDKKTAELADRKYSGYWQSRSTGSKILGALALALGSYGSALTGTRNTAWDIIQKAMDEDFSAFKDQTQNKIAAMNQTDATYNTKRDFAFRRIADIQAKLTANNAQVDKMIDSLKLKYSDEASIATLDGFKAKLAEANSKNEAAFAKDLASVLGQEAQQKILNAQLEPKEDPELHVPGFGSARSKKEAQDLRSKTAETVGNVQTIDRILELQKKASRLNPDVAESYKARQQIQNEIASLVGSMRIDLVGPGAMTDSEREFIQGIIGDPTSIFSFSSVELAKLLDIRNKAVRNLDNIAKQVIVNYQGYQGTDIDSPKEQPKGKVLKASELP